MLMVSSAFLQVGRTEFAHRHRAASSQGDAVVKLLTRNEGRGIEVLRMKARNSNSRVSALLGAYVWFGYLLLQPGWVFSQVPFYQGKTITIISGQEPGGTGDMRLKALLRYLKKHIPGQPILVPEYMPGGGGRKAANYMYRTA